MTGAAGNDPHMAMYTCTMSKEISLARELQPPLSNPSYKNDVIDQGKYRNGPVKGSGTRLSIMSKTERMCHKHM